MNSLALALSGCLHRPPVGDVALTNLGPCMLETEELGLSSAELYDQLPPADDPIGRCVLSYGLEELPPGQELLVLRRSIVGARGSGWFITRATVDERGVLVARLWPRCPACLWQSDVRGRYLFLALVPNAAYRWVEVDWGEAVLWW